ncbi:uncharacterized protein TRUGW13939_06049 [Talaromyces rugulosus]|uniref:Uncharacterized protein n=1 Tax=Talaromyces rugulosus TaxID=121627 RepID=A0A7H8QZT7_TALRU|nr:uncharacterized protein TRUGW13939_06049 [Talaromyces rugulosus]QKX58921.1 hypothetical protein TRUGW13939_06049 [Talaromyces rugulosus]
MSLTDKEKVQILDRLGTHLDDDKSKRDQADAYQIRSELGPIYTPVTWSASEEQVNEGWGPLASVIEKCNNLTDLIWSCENQFPPCLLRAIERKHPNCRLHLRLFRFHSLTASGEVDGYERELVESFNLHSISVRPFPNGLNGKPDYNMDAFYHVLNAAPNLKHVSILPASQSEELGRSLAEDDGWKGFQPPLRSLEERSLSSLMLLYGHELKVEDLSKLSKYTDLSKIRFLTLEGVTDPEVFTYLSKNVTFASLEMLDIHSCPQGDRGDSTSFAAAFSSLLNNLEPLKDVRLSGYLMNSLVESVVRRHGQTLLNMTLHPLDDRRSLCGLYCPFFARRTGTTLLDKYYFCEVCPDLHSLRELTLHFEDMRDVGREYPVTFYPSKETFHSAVEEVWKMIQERKEKPLSALHAIAPAGLCVFTKTLGTSDKESSIPINGHDKRPTYRTHEYMFRALPGADFDLE